MNVKEGWEAGSRRRLAAAVRRGDVVALGTGTDPYQPAEGAARATRRFLELAAEVRGQRLTVTTKGSLLLRDLDLLRPSGSAGACPSRFRSSHSGPICSGGSSPGRPRPACALEVMRRLVAEGFDVGVAIAPILPALTDSEADLEALVASVAAAGVRRLSWRLLFLQSPTREKYLEWLRRELAASARAPGLSGLYSRLPRR